MTSGGIFRCLPDSEPTLLLSRWIDKIVKVITLLVTVDVDDVVKVDVQRVIPVGTVDVNKSLDDN
jgi:hypothetical protein